jgi:hypothetical protein
VTNDDASSVSQQTSRTKGKRGRKLTADDIYKEQSLQKIAELQADLKKKGLSVAERQKIRNKISAQQSRLKKKEEYNVLDATYKHLLDRFSMFTQILDSELVGE